MHSLFLACFFAFIPNSVLTIIPAPHNLSVFSVNFHHVLRWEPGPGTALGTQYHIFTREHGFKHKQQRNLTTNTSVVLKLENYQRYFLTVQASYNQTFSPESSCTFTPYKETRVGPPVLSLKECSDCLHLTISLPEADKDSGIVDIQKFYSARFRILCRSGKNTVYYLTKERNNTLPNLNKGVEYCVQVHIETALNKNTEPSAWTCVFTGYVKSQNDSVVIGSTAGVLILVLGFLTTCVLCLHYMGFLCKLKSPPTALTILSNGYILTPEGTTGDQVFIASEEENHNIHSRRAPLHPIAANNYEEDDNEDEEEAFVNYMNREAKPPSKQTLSLSTIDLTEAIDPSVSENSPSLRGRLDTQQEVKFNYIDMCQDEATEIHSEVISKKVTCEVLYGDLQEEDMTKQSSDILESTNDVNLFSVTLAALSAAKEEREEEENTIEDITTLIVQSHVLNMTDVQNETDDRCLSVLRQNDDFSTDCREEGQGETDKSEYKLHFDQIEDEEDNGGSNTFAEYVANR